MIVIQANRARQSKLPRTRRVSIPKVIPRPILLRFFEDTQFLGLPPKSLNTWWARWDSNPGPKDYESSALTN